MATEDALCMGLCLLIEWQMRAERSISQDVSHDENDWMVRFTDTPPFDGEAEKNKCVTCAANVDLACARLAPFSAWKRRRFELGYRTVWM